MGERIFIGSDHGGFDLKKSLKELLAAEGITVEDVGTDSHESVDYPVYAHKLCSSVKETGGMGILICGTGLGMSMAANKNSGIRAALCSEPYSSRMAREHNNANVLCMGGRVVGPNLALDIVRAFLSASFEGGRHNKRIEMLEPLSGTSE